MYDELYNIAPVLGEKGIVDTKTDTLLAAYTDHKHSKFFTDFLLRSGALLASKLTEIRKRCDKRKWIGFCVANFILIYAIITENHDLYWMTWATYLSEFLMMAPIYQTVPPPSECKKRKDKNTCSANC